MLLLLTLFSSSLIALAGIHIAALKFFLYWKYPWLDIPVHLLGGITCAFGFSLYMYKRKLFASPRKELFVYVVFALVIGIGWEIFEIGMKFSVVDDHFLTDTIMDLSMDILGGVLGYGIVGAIKKIL